jgi:hypothetical protein
VTAPFTAQLRTRGAAIRLGADDASERWTVRVQVAEAWDAVRVSAPPSEPVLSLKRAALEALRPDVGRPDDYVVKLAGVVVDDEHASLAEAGAADGSIFLVMLRRRQPVR